MKKHMQAATTAHFRKMNMGGVSLLLFKTVVFLATMFSTTIIIAEPRSVDVYTGSMSVGELQVDNNAVNYDWDINRIYAVSNSSNSGFNILSAYHDGTDIIYKESPNVFAYKQGNTTTVKNITNNLKTQLYPNPASDKIYLSYGDNVSYHITDLTGKVVLVGTYDGKGIDVNKLSTGFYILKMKNAHNKPSSIKFIKQ